MNLDLSKKDFILFLVPTFGYFLLIVVLDLYGDAQSFSNAVELNNFNKILALITFIYFIGVCITFLIMTIKNDLSKNGKIILYILLSVSLIVIIVEFILGLNNITSITTSNYSAITLIVPIYYILIQKDGEDEKELSK